mmetsp:Transcript_30477/g.72481  ORF Transcript_30477/g.72481 Transcript_30477/m.72481 type:complete len:230 (-) Transcript_30477:1115-1804(-)
MKSETSLSGSADGSHVNASVLASQQSRVNAFTPPLPAMSPWLSDGAAASEWMWKTVSSGPYTEGAVPCDATAASVNTIKCGRLVGLLPPRNTRVAHSAVTATRLPSMKHAVGGDVAPVATDLTERYPSLTEILHPPAPLQYVDTVVGERPPKGHDVPAWYAPQSPSTLPQWAKDTDAITSPSPHESVCASPCATSTHTASRRIRKKPSVPRSGTAVVGRVGVKAGRGAV